jgi:hypothetical protein
MHAWNDSNYKYKIKLWQSHNSCGGLIKTTHKIKDNTYCFEVVKDII